MFKELRVRYLLSRMKSKNADTLTVAAAQLAQLGDPRAVQPLIDTLMTTGLTEEVYVAVTEALGGLGDARAVEPLMFTLEKREFSNPPLSHRLSEGVWSDLSCAVAKALGELRDPRCVSTLIGALGYKPSIRKAAALALKELGESDWVTVIKGDDGDWQRIAQTGHALAYMPLSAALHKPTRDMLSAVHAIGDVRMVDPLIMALGDYRDPENRKAAASALHSLGEVKWSEIVKGTDDDWQALGNCGDIRAMKALERVIAALDDRAVMNRIGAGAQTKLEQMARQAGIALPSHLLHDAPHEQRKVQEAKIRKAVISAMENLTGLLVLVFPSHHRQPITPALVRAAASQSGLLKGKIRQMSGPTTMTKDQAEALLAQIDAEEKTTYLSKPFTTGTGTVSGVPFAFIKVTA